MGNAGGFIHRARSSGELEGSGWRTIGDEAANFTVVSAKGVNGDGLVDIVYASDVRGKVFRWSQALRNASVTYVAFSTSPSQPRRRRTAVDPARRSARPVQRRRPPAQRTPRAPHGSGHAAGGRVVIRLSSRPVCDTPGRSSTNPHPPCVPRQTQSVGWGKPQAHPNKHLPPS